MSVRAEALALQAKVNKKLGPHSVIRASEMSHVPPFTTGSLGFDVALGGGWVANNWNEVIGNESHGKTAITLKTIAANQRINPEFTTLWVAAEPYDADQAAALGVENGQVFLEPSRDMVEIYGSVCDFLASRAVDMIVIDSYPALIPPDEDLGSMGDMQVAEGARLTGKFFRKVGKAGARNPLDPTDAPWTGIFINQYRDTIGSWAPAGYKGITPGGKAKNYSFYQRVDVTRGDWLKEKIEGKGEIKVGQEIRLKAIKNKGGPPQRVGTVDFYYQDTETLGFSRGDYDVAKETFIVAALYDVFKKRGSWYDYEGHSWNGGPATLKGIQDEGLVEEIAAKARERAFDPRIKKEWDEEDLEEIKSEPPKRRLTRAS